MSAECEKHGVDLHGSQWSAGGLVCPVCERDDATERLLDARDEAHEGFVEWAEGEIERQATRADLAEARAEALTASRSPGR